jgi:hypothetical protein
MVNKHIHNTALLQNMPVTRDGYSFRLVSNGSSKTLNCVHQERVMHNEVNNDYIQKIQKFIP